MRIGVSLACVLNSVSQTEHTEYYVAQLIKEGHEIVIISDSNSCHVDNIKKWLLTHNLKCKIMDASIMKEQVEKIVHLDMYIWNNLKELLLLTGKIKHILFFSESIDGYTKDSQEITCVGDWWGIYNYIRYET